MDIRIKTVSGEEIREHIPELAKLRIQVFRDFPYLYKGSWEYEKKYLKTYLRSDKTVFVLVIDGDEVVGASSGMPLELETQEVKRPFEMQGLNADEVFYFGESVLDKRYRGRGFGKRFYTERENHAQSHGFTWCAFCGVVRPENHPLRPAGHRPLDAFWISQGYDKKPEMTTFFEWQDVGQPQPTKKEMVFWMKKIR